MADKNEDKNAGYWHDKLASKLPDLKLIVSRFGGIDKTMFFPDEETFLVTILRMISQRIASRADWLAGVVSQPAGYEQMLAYKYLKEKERLTEVRKLVERMIALSLRIDIIVMDSHSKDGPLLKDPECVYSQNPKKYDGLIRSSIRRGVNVYGLESEKREETNGKTFKDWAKYVKENGKGLCIVLIGAGHVDYWKGHPDDSKNFVSKLVGLGVPLKSVMTISSFPVKTGRGSSAGLEALYSVKRLPKNVAVPEIGSYLRVDATGINDKNDVDIIDSASVPTFGEKGGKRGKKTLLMPKLKYFTRTVYIPAFVNGKEIVDYIYTIDRGRLERAMKKSGKVDID